LEQSCQSQEGQPWNLKPRSKETTTSDLWTPSSMTVQLRDQNGPRCQSLSLKRISDWNPRIIMMPWSSK
jgi:hypothetical protein